MASLPSRGSSSLSTDHSPLSTTLTCPHCKSTDLRRLSLIYAEGVHESRGSLLAVFFGGSAGLFFGRHNGLIQSRLARMVRPPAKLPYTGPIILWLFGFFILTAFEGRGRLSWIMGMLSLGYFLLLPLVLVGILAYNLSIYRAKHRKWKNKFMCQRCGAVTEASGSSNLHA